MFIQTHVCASPVPSLSAVVQQVIKNNLMLHFFRRRCIFNMQDAHLHTVKSNMTRPKNYISPPKKEHRRHRVAMMQFFLHYSDDGMKFKLPKWTLDSSHREFDSLLHRSTPAQTHCKDTQIQYMYRNGISFKRLNSPPTKLMDQSLESCITPVWKL